MKEKDLSKLTQQELLEEKERLRDSTVTALRALKKNETVLGKFHKIEKARIEDDYTRQVDLIDSYLLCNTKEKRRTQKVQCKIKKFKERFKRKKLITECCTLKQKYKGDEIYNEEEEVEPEKPPAPSLITAEQKKQLVDLGSNLDALALCADVDSIDKLPADVAQFAINQKMAQKLKSTLSNSPPKDEPPPPIPPPERKKSNPKATPASVKSG